MSNIENKIIHIIDDIRPYLVADGGDIEFVKYENKIVYVRMHGACANCYMQDSTLKDGIENIIKEEIGENIEVINII